jgi:hypothetical protein
MKIFFIITCLLFSIPLISMDENNPDDISEIKPRQVNSDDFVINIDIPQAQPQSLNRPCCSEGTRQNLGLCCFWGTLVSIPVWCLIIPMLILPNM